MATHKPTYKTLKVLLAVLPFAVILSVIYGLEYFGRKRMGMMRYLVFMKREFENGYFQPMSMFGISAIVAVVMVYIAWKLIKAKPEQVNILAYWLCSMSVLNVWLSMPQTRALKSFHFGLIGWLVLGTCVSGYSIWKLKQLKR